LAFVSAVVRLVTLAGGIFYADALVWNTESQVSTR
jgi:hypothetical protein